MSTNNIVMMDMPMNHTASNAVHMWMYFHTTLADQVLFDFWKITTVGEMILSCVIVIVLGSLLEAFKYLRFVIEQRHRRQTIRPPHTMYATFALDKSYAKQLFTPYHLAQTILFGIQVALSYSVMLIFMTFSIWLCLAVVLGVSIGYYFFGAREYETQQADGGGDPHQ